MTEGVVNKQPRGYDSTKSQGYKELEHKLHIWEPQVNSRTLHGSYAPPGVLPTEFRPQDFSANVRTCLALPGEMVDSGELEGPAASLFPGGGG